MKTKKIIIVLALLLLPFFLMATSTPPVYAVSVEIIAEADHQVASLFPDTHMVVLQLRTEGFTG